MSRIPFNVFVSFQYRRRGDTSERVLVVAKAHSSLVEAYPQYTWPDGDPTDQLHAAILAIVAIRDRKDREKQVELLFEDWEAPVEAIS